MKSTVAIALAAAVSAAALVSTPRVASAERYAYGSGASYALRCESPKYRDRYCSADTRGGVQIIRQISRTPCRLGDNWGYDRRGIWVTAGCAAEFMVGHGWSPGPDYGYGRRPPAGDGYPSWGNGRVLRCESHDYRDNYCPANVRYGVEILRQISDSPCRYGRTWGYDRRGIWVADGCAAEFRVG